MVPHEASGRKSDIANNGGHQVSITKSNVSVPLLVERVNESEDLDHLNEQVRAPEDGEDGSRDSGSGKRKYADREPESPGQDDPNAPVPYAKKERTYYGDMDTDSPASYPKHVIVPSEQKEGQLGSHEESEEALERGHEPHPAFEPEGKSGNLLTPDSAGRGRPEQGYDAPIYPRHQPYHDVYRAPSYNPEMDYGRSNYGHHQQMGDNYGSRPPRRWACDYCNVATFLSYEEACAHEEACARRHHEGHYQDSRHPPRPPVATYGRPPPHHQPPGGSGLGALYHASQEVVTPPTPHHQQQSQWGSRGPPLPVLPHEQTYYRQGYYDRRDDPVSYHDPYYPVPQGHPHHQHHQQLQYYQKRMLLAMPSDKDSLSDRQCYVRSEMVEIFAATDKDVSARHSKGAQKLVMGQVGIRCVHCSHLRPRDRAERAVCYPSSISRIYQTVADMQRFHFEQCREIPEHVHQLYKKLKTTRPRGVGSPQTYWVSSAKSLGLVDTDGGIRFDTDVAKGQQYRQNSDMSVSTP